MFLEDREMTMTHSAMPQPIVTVIRPFHLDSSASVCLGRAEMRLEPMKLEEEEATAGRDGCS